MQGVILILISQIPWLSTNPRAKTLNKQDKSRSHHTGIFNGILYVVLLQVGTPKELHINTPEKETKNIVYKSSANVIWPKH